MPDNTSPFDDPFADLYGKLPDPAHRDRESEAPLSRRAAREARENAVANEPTEDAAPVTPPATPEPATPPAADAPRPAITRPRAEEPAVTRPLPQVPAAEVPAPRPVSPEPEAAPFFAAAAPAARSTAGPARTVQGRSSSSAGRGRGRSGSIEALFAGERSTDDVGTPPPPPNRKRRRVGVWVALAIVVVIVGGITAGGLYVWNTYEDRIRAFMGWEEPKDFEAGMANGSAQITIASGDAGPQVSQKAYDAGVIRSPDALYDYMITNNVAYTFQPGVYQLQLQMTSEAVLAALSEPGNRLENTTQLREGLTVDQSVTEISEQMGMPLEDLQAAVADPSQYGVAADSLEGWLFPATYTFDPGVTATDVIRRMVDRSVQSLDEHGVAEGDRQRILTIASIIQREARSTDDFYRVSRVIENRLDPGNQETFGLLQMDSTAQYGYGELHAGTASSSAEALADDNPWNTYVHTGLPVGPISNPGDLAIDAAINPADGPWLYFVTVNLDTGETVFTTTAAEHQAAVDQWIQWCRANPDSGC